MKRIDVEREIQRVMMEHELNLHPKPLSVTTCYPDVPTAGTVHDVDDPYWTRKVGELTVRAYEIGEGFELRFSNGARWVTYYAVGRTTDVYRAICTALDIPICPESVHKDDMRAPEAVK